MFLYHVAVVAAGWSCLGFAWGYVVYFPGYFVDERKHHAERYAVAAEYLLAEPVAMVAEIACEDGCYVEVLTEAEDRLSTLRERLPASSLSFLPSASCEASMNMGISVNPTRRLLVNDCMG